MPIILALIIIILIALYIFAAKAFLMLMVAFDTAMLGYIIWTITHGLLGWHPVFVILSIVFAVGLWHYLMSLKFLKFRWFALIGALFSAGFAFYVLNTAITSPEWMVFGSKVAQSFDLIWQIFLGVIILAIVLAGRFRKEIEYYRAVLNSKAQQTPGDIQTG